LEDKREHAERLKAAKEALKEETFKCCKETRVFENDGIQYNCRKTAKRG
jgi:hypothetical protein